MNLSEELISNLKTIIEINKKKNYDMSNKDIWRNRMPVWFSKIIKNEKIDWDMLENFRGYQLLISEVPHRHKNWFKNFFYKLIRDPGNKKYCIENYKKLCSINYDKKLKDYSFSLVGNPGFYTHNGIRFNERWLRHVRNCELFKQYICHDKSLKLNVIDIGGGYSQFVCMLKETAPINKVATVDYMEQLFLSHYFIKKNFPNAKVNTLKEIIEADIIDEEFIKRFDFILIPIECYNKIKSGLFNVVCNFSSLGEMSREAFNAYNNSQILKKSKFFFTINRLDSWPTYENLITILDYNLDDYAPIHKSTSPLVDYYYVSHTFFLIKKIRFKSRNFEFIGKRKI
jgi:putative sugar O-methyltransferase